MTLSAKPDNKTTSTGESEDSESASNQHESTATETTPAERSAATTDQLTIDETFEILKNNRRRIVLKHLQGKGVISLGELADHVTAVENDTEIADITSTQRKRVYVGLYQFHLPKMKEVGVIEFDKDRGDVALTLEGRNLIERHEQETTQKRHWHRYTLSLAGVGLLAAVGSLLVANAAVATGFLLAHAVLVGILGTGQYLLERDNELPDLV